jgi:hypothetical protein
MENILVFGSVVMPHTTSETPICMSRLGIISVSADAAEAPTNSITAIAHPSPRKRFRPDKLLMSISIDFDQVAKMLRATTGQQLQEVGQMIYSESIDLVGICLLGKQPLGRL